MKKRILIMASIILVLAMVSMTAGYSATSVTKISLNNPKITLKIGQTYVIRPVITPSNATDTKLLFSSSYKKIATVDKNGKVTAIRVGTTVIIVTSSVNKKATAKCSVTVLKAGAKSSIEVLAEKGGKLIGIAPTGIEDQCKQAIAAFNKKYPKWKIELSYAADFETKQKIALGAKEGMDFMWSGGSDYPMIWGEQEALVPLDPYIEQEGIDMYGVYYKSYVDELKYMGQQLLLPTDCFTYALWYNKVLFDKAGVPYPAADKSYSFDELLEIGKKLTMDTDKDGKTDTWALSLLTPTWHIVQPWYNSCGAQILSDDGKTAKGYVDSPEFIDFVTKYRDLIWKYEIAMPLNIAPDGDAWSVAWSNGFLAGKAAMHVSAPWMIPEADNQEKAHPELLKWGTALPPHLAGDRPYSIGGTAGWGIPVTCRADKRALVFKLIWEIAAGKGAEYWYDQGKMWTTKVGMTKFLSKSEKNAGWVNAADFLVPMEQARKPVWKSSVEPSLTQLISAAVVNRMDPAKACKEAAIAIDKAIQVYEASK